MLRFRSLALDQHPTRMTARLAEGLVLAALLALVALHAGALSRSGALAATTIGAAAVAAGWRWGALLALYFVVLAGLSHAVTAGNPARAGGVLAKEGARDALQVLANGAAFAAFALLAAWRAHGSGHGGSATLAAAALGALAASAADTSATEMGMRFGGIPRSVLTRQPVPSGSSGAVSGVGTIAMLGGGLFVALAAAGLALTHDVIALALAGASGAMADTLLGATLQARRWCPACGRTTERRLHDCGAPTIGAGGRAWMDNDTVNLLATLVGAAVAAGLATP